jgi:hypothetical protein
MDDTRSRRMVSLGINLVLDATAAEVAIALRNEGVRAILLKGPPLVRWLYGNDSARSSVDVDLLVAPGQLSAAEAALVRLDFSRLATGTGETDRPRHASTWSPHTGAPCVDLHTTIVGIGHSAAHAWNLLSARTEHLEIGGGHIEVLAPPARAMHVVLHAAQHGVREPQPLQDLERALEALPEEIWREAAELAAQLEAIPAFAAGLSLVPAGRELLARLGLPAKGSVESVLRAASAPPLALGLEWLARAPSPGARVRFVVRKIIPPPSFMRIWSPLARRGRAGLAAAYVWRSVWLLLKAGPALRAWRRARRESHA